MQRVVRFDLTPQVATPIGSRPRRGAAVIAAGLTAMALLCTALQAWSQSSSASYQLPRQTVDAGAGASSSATYALSGSIGQPDAESSTSASYSLQGGFHRAAPAPQADPIFANGFEN